MQYTPIDKLGGDLNSHESDNAGLAERVDRLVHDVGSAALENGRSALHDLQNKTDEVTKDVAALYTDGAAILRKRVASQPIAAITIAMAAGAFLAGLMLRK